MIIFIKINCKTGRPGIATQLRIINGSNAGVGEFPFMVSCFV